MNRILHLTLICSLLFLSRAAIDPNLWEFFTDNAIQIALRGTRLAKLLSTSQNNDGYAIQFFDPVTKVWGPAGTQAFGRKIAIGASGEYFTTNSKRLFSRKHSTATPNPAWNLESGLYTYEFAPAPDGQIFHTHGFPEYDSSVGKFNPVTKSGVLYLMQARKIAVDSTGNRPWVLKANGDIFKYDGTSWIQMPGKANDVILGANNRAIIVSQDPTPEGFAIKRWIGGSDGSWETIPGIGGISLAIDPGTSQQLYVVTNDNKVYREKGVSSSICPMCKENCPECANYEGYCRTGNNQCINCPLEHALVTSPSLRCLACPTGCQECSTSTTCTTCKPEYHLNSAGTCDKICANEPTCGPCPDNCLQCTSATFCLQCSATHYLSPIATCVASCDPPLVSSTDAAGNLSCKGPCATDPSNPHYYSSDNSCRPTCAASICLL